MSRDKPPFIWLKPEYVGKYSSSDLTPQTLLYGQPSGYVSHTADSELGYLSGYAVVIQRDRSDSGGSRTPNRLLQHSLGYGQGTRWKGNFLAHSKLSNRQTLDLSTTSLVAALDAFRGSRRRVAEDTYELLTEIV